MRRLRRQQLKVSCISQAIETSEKQTMRLQLEKSSSTVSRISSKCPFAGMLGSQSLQTDKFDLVLPPPLEFKGNVGEALDHNAPSVPGFTSTTHVEIVKQK